MAENDYAYLEEALPGFTQARTLVKEQGDRVICLGFVGTKFDFYRFANRFRLAAAFRGMRLDGFSEETVLGYDALTRVFFTWSAFERYTELVNDRPPFSTLFANYPRRHIKELAAKCRELDPKNLLCDFLVKQSLQPIHEKHLQLYRDGKDFDVLTLAASIRHIFAHGMLTAHPNKLPAENMTLIANHLADFLIEFVRSDFGRRLKLAAGLHGNESLPS